MLTEERIEALWQNNLQKWELTGKVLISPTVFARAIEAEVLQAQEPAAEVVREYFAGRDHWDFRVFDKSLKHGAKLYSAPQPPAPCPETESAVRYLKAVQQMGAAEIAELKAKVKGIEKDRDAAWSINPAVSEQMLLAKVAKQSAEFTAFHNRAHNYSEKQSALIKELTETRDALWETQRSLCNQVYELDMLIEKCERVLRDLTGMGFADMAIAAIAAHKKGGSE